ncbi:MAG: hypothetical protein AAGJ85_04720, partial [Pseudomonadota bacterium]
MFAKWQRNCFNYHASFGLSRRGTGEEWLMHWSLFASAGVALIGAHALRLPVAGGRFGAIGAFLGGLLLAVFAVKGVAKVSDIGRTTDFDKIVNAAVAEAVQDDRPLIVFTGASYSRNALDPERLTLALN